MFGYTNIRKELQMNIIWERLKACKEYVAIILFLVIAVGGLISVKGIADDVKRVKEKEVKVDKALVDISKVAQQVQANQEAIWDWKTFLRNYLITKGAKEESVKLWLLMPIGTDDLIVGGDTLINIPYICRADLPEIGVSCLMRRDSDSVIVVDTIRTLWKYSESK